MHCTEPVLGSYDPSSDRGALPIQSLEQVSGAPKASFGLDAIGDLQTTTYDYGSGNLNELGTSYLGDISHGFTASYGNSEGSVSMTLTELTVVSSLPDAGKVYDVHGSADATLVGHGDATGQQVTAHIDF